MYALSILGGFRWVLIWGAIGFGISLTVVCGFILLLAYCTPPVDYIDDEAPKPYGNRGGQRGQSTVEYAAMLAIILIIVVGTVAMIGHNASGVFSNVSSSLIGQ